MTKPFLNYENQIGKLKNKGLSIEDENYAVSVLKKYSYYRLITGYKTIFKNPVNQLYYRGVRLKI